jgi:branched-chain amino acid transport system substrate-binding protein
MLKRFFMITFLPVVLLVLTGFSVLAEESIKIGAMNCLSGPIGVLGVDQSRAAQLAVEQINRSGGILGKKVEILVRDDEMSPSTATRVARKLIMEDGVKFIVGVNGTPAAMAVSELANRFKTIYLSSGGAQAAALTGKNCNRYTFRINQSGGQFYRADAAYVAETFPKIKSVAGINPDYSYGHEMWEGFTSNLKKKRPGVKVVAEVFVPTAEKDFSNYIDAVLEKKPDFVYSVFWSGAGVAFIKQAKPYGFFEKTKFELAAASIGTSCIFMGKDMVPIWGSSPYIFTLDNPMNNQFVAEYEKRYGHPPHSFCGHAYATIFILKQAIEKAGSTDADKVIAALEGSTFDTPWGKMFIRAEDHQAMGKIFIGEVKPNPKYGYYTLSDYRTIPAEDVALAVSETGCKMK